jgi:hypothetical protein
MSGEPEKENDLLNSLLHEEENLSEIEDNSAQPEAPQAEDLVCADGSGEEEADSDRRSRRQTERGPSVASSATKNTRSRTGRRSGSASTRRKRSQGRKKERMDSYRPSQPNEAEQAVRGRGSQEGQNSTKEIPERKEEALSSVPPSVPAAPESVAEKK